MYLESNFEHLGSIDKKYTCDGDNINPPLAWGEAPDDAQSLVLLMDDPDVPREVREDRMFDHWVLYNIPTDSDGLAEGEVLGEVGLNTKGDAEYTGPCPPKEYEPTKHRYMFRLYAVDTMLTFTQPPTKEEVEKAVEGHVLASAQLTGTYERA